MRAKFVDNANCYRTQILLPTSPLVEEALTKAVSVDVDGTPARVFTTEHLAAIALQTGRAKDHARLLQFIEAAALDAQRLQTLLQQHGLVEKSEKHSQVPDQPVQINDQGSAKIRSLEAQYPLNEIKEAAISSVTDFRRYGSHDMELRAKLVYVHKDNPVLD